MNMNPHLAIPAKDLSASIAFYQLLGFSVEQQYEKPGSELRITRLCLNGDFVIELMAHPDTKDMSFGHAPELQHIGIAVHDLDEVLAKLQTIGTTILKPITAGVAVKRYAFVSDPSGFPVELFEALEK